MGLYSTKHLGDGDHLHHFCPFLQMDVRMLHFQVVLQGRGLAAGGLESAVADDEGGHSAAAFCKYISYI